MKQKLPVTRIVKWLLLVSSALVISFSLSHLVRQRAVTKLTSRIPAVTSLKPKPERSGDYLLADSILSIVQSYYVDANRVTNTQLINTLIAALNTNPRIKAGLDGNRLVIGLPDRTEEIQVADLNNYQSVMTTMTTVAGFLDREGLTLLSNEPYSKNESGGIVLLNSILAALDAHSALLSPDAYRELRQGTEGSFGGLGVLVGMRDHLLTVIKPLPRSPAFRAGIKKHDRILGIDGVFTFGYSLDELVEHMRGDPGTPVHLSLLRDGAQMPAELVLNREVIQVDSVETVTHTVRGMKILQLKIENFASRTSKEVLAAIRKFRQQNKGTMQGLILDLRSNPGGLLDQAVQVADLFLEDGVIVSTKGRREEVEQAGSGFDEVGFPMVVLMNEDSASASEIVAGALQDHGRAVVVGQPSFGKGSVQTIFELPGERALKLTIARYFTPHGGSIQNVGIIPDIWMQPVARHPSNENLFGSWRYKNERFLKNHLEAAEDTQGSEQTGHIMVPERKVYYLGDEPGTDESAVVDREFQFATMIFESLQKTYGSKLPRSAARASHWLGLAGPALSRAADKLDQETSRWLREKHQIVWNKPQVRLANPLMKVEILNDNPRRVSTGEWVDVKWLVRNEENVPVDRVSLFVRSESPDIETREILIGDIAAHGTREGTLTMYVPRDLRPEPLMLRIGAALDAWPVAGAAADFILDVSAKPSAEVEVVTELSGEQGGSVPGAVEGSENAMIKVTVANRSEVPARKLALRVHNLSGRQIEIDDKELTIDELQPGQSEDITVSLKASKYIYSSEIGFGLHLESDDLRMPFRKRFIVPGKPNAESAKRSTLSSH